MGNISYIKEPSAVVLTGNPIQIIARCEDVSDYPVDIMMHQNCELYITIAHVEDDSMVFTYGDHSITFTCKDDPDDTGLQYHSNSGGLPLQDWIRDVLMEDLRKNQELSNDFSLGFTSGYSFIQFYPRLPGEDYLLYVTGGPTGTTGPASWGGEMGKNDYTLMKTFHRLVFRIIKYFDYNSENTYLQSVEKIIAETERDSSFYIEKYFDPDEYHAESDFYAGVAEIDVREYLKTEQTQHFEFPETSDTLYYARSTILSKFQVFAFERHSIPLTTNDGAFTSWAYALQGKISDIRFGTLNDQGIDYWQMLINTKMFLTWSPNPKITDIYAPEKLYFIFKEAITARLWIREYYEDGSTSTSQLLSIAVQQYTLYEFVVSFVKIFLQSGNVVTKYQVWLEDPSSTKLSEIREYTIDYKYYRNARYFIFKNSHGVYDTIRFTGEAIQKLSVSKNFSTIKRELDYTHRDRLIKQISADSSVKWTINSGYIPDLNTALYLQEFLESDDVYWCKNSVAYPVNIEKSDNVVNADSTYLRQVDFDLTHAVHDDFTNDFSGNEPISDGDFDDDFNDDFYI